MAVAAGLKDFQQVCDERGLGIWNQNIKQIAKQMKQAKEDGVTLAFQTGKLPLILNFDSDLPAETQTEESE